MKSEHRSGAEERSSIGRGAIVLVGTPIGNLEDLSPRAVRALSDADVIACEDTRRTRKLLTHAGIHGGRLVTVHDHNEAREVRRLVERAENGECIAVVTDAGMPGISDPGERLVRAAAASGVAVEVVPGPSAAVSALVVSGLPTGRFVFEGFLPRKGSGRTERLAALADERRTAVLFEAPHRVVETVTDLAGSLGGDRRIAIVRELTKMFEEIWRGTLADATAWVASHAPRGEYALVVEGAPDPGPSGDDDLEQALRAELAAGSDKKTAIATVASAHHAPKRRVYDIATRL